MVNRALKTWNRWHRDQAGSIVPMFALMLAVIAGFSGLALDYARQDRLRSRLSQAADAATLTAARAAASAQEANPAANPESISLQAQELGRASFTSNVKDLGDVKVSNLDVSVTFQDGYWTAKSEYKAMDHTTLAAALGKSYITIGGKSEASLSPGFPVLDIAMCIDSTGSMSATLDAVKTNAINFYDNLNAALAAKGIAGFPLVRVRLLYFKDFGDLYGGSDPDPLVASNFFELPDKKGDFNAFASPQAAYGGLDTPESGLECLNDAISSPWMKVGDSVSGYSQKVTDVYSLIIVWTDAPAHPINFPNSVANSAYPSASSMPRDYATMLAKWKDSDVINQQHKQILFFGDPDITSPDQTDASGVFYPSAWQEVKTWPKFTVGGTLTEATTDPIEFIANGIAKTAKGLRLTN